MKEQQSKLLVEWMKNDLKSRCAKLPESAWKRFEERGIPITSFSSSDWLKRSVVGYEEIDIDLTRDGVITETLVHYTEDSYSSEMQEPYRVLGETSDERYRKVYGLASGKLESLERTVAS